ncbi:MAG: hypothetical protein ACQES2_07930 [Pseudomonadota bacterium]
MDWLKTLTEGASPYLFALVYDIDERALILEVVKDPKRPDAPCRRAIFTGVTHFSEENLLDEPDDENLDDVVDILPLSEGGFAITTYKKAITVLTGEEPLIEDAD